jgi:MFS family permease
MPGIFALAVAYVLSQFYRSFLAVLTPALTADLGATKADLSLASGIYFLTFALAQFPIGVSLDRFGPRLTCAVLLAAGGAGGALVFSLAQSPWMVVAAMALIGIGCAPVLMASLFIFARIYTPARFAVLISWLIAFGALGNVVGASPLANAAQALGWRPVMAGLGLFTLLSALSILLLVRDPPAPQDMNPDGRGLRGYLDLLKIPVLWPIIPITALNYAPPIGIRGLWAGPYLQDVYGADAITIGNITFFMALAMVAGNFIYGPLDTLLRTRKWVGVGGTALALAALGYLALNVVTDTTMVTLLLIIIGLAGGAYGLLMAHARAFFPPHLLGRGVTLMNFFTIGGVGIMQFATGAVVSAAAEPSDPGGPYAALFGFYFLLLAAALAIYLFSRDARPERR